MKRVNSYDFVQRTLHWWLALSVVCLSLSGWYASQLDAGSERSFMWLMHARIGHIFCLGLILRMLWGVIGPFHARLESYIFLGEWLASLRNPKLLSADGAFGHHPQASVTYLGFYVLSLGMGATGLWLAASRHGQGLLAERFADDLRWDEWVGLTHETGWYLMVIFVIGHVGALIYHERADGIPIAQSMISGFQYRQIKGGFRHEKNVFSRDESIGGDVERRES